MARYTESQCRLCRRETMKLYLKGDRCYSDKCAIERRNYPPGQHGQGRGKLSDYGLQLREKQKIKRMYGLVEKQFESYFKEADRQKGVTGTNFLVLARTQAGQYGLPARFRQFPQPGQTARQARSFSGQRQESKHSLVSAEAGRHGCRGRGEPQSADHKRIHGSAAAQRSSCLARPRYSEVRGHLQGLTRPERR